MRQLSNPCEVSSLDYARAVMLCPTTVGRSAASIGNDALVNEYLTWMRDTRGRAPQTTYNYASLLAMYLDDVVGDSTLEDVQLAVIEAWLLRPRTGVRHRGQVGAPATRARNIAILRSLYKYLQARGHVAHNVTDLLVAPTIHNAQPKPVSDAVFHQLWTSNLSETDRIMVGLGYWLGLRRQEIVTLTGEHVDITNGQIVGFDRKGGSQDTLPYRELLSIWAEMKPNLPVGDSFEKLLEQPTTGPLVGGEPYMVNKRLARCLRAADMNPTTFTPHQLRHSFASSLIRIGMPLAMVTSLCNHSDPKVTMRYIKTGGSFHISEWREATKLRVQAKDWR